MLRIMLLMILLRLVSCYDVVLVNEKRDSAQEWTIMVYLDGDNNLESAAIEDFNEMEEGVFLAGDPNKYNIIVLIDRAEEDFYFGYTDIKTDEDGSNWDDTRLYKIYPDNKLSTTSYFVSERLDDGRELDHHIKSLGEKNMGDPETLSWFIKYCKEEYPSDKYALILWNHGGGARDNNEENLESDSRAISWDDSHSDPNSSSYTKTSDKLYLDEVQQAVSENFGKEDKLDLIGFDACLMGTVEVAYEFKDLAKSMVASMNSEQGDGWDYSYIFQKTNEISNSTEFGNLIVESYKNFISSSLYYRNRGETLTNINLEKMDELKLAIDDLSSEIGKNVDNKLLFRNLRNNVLRYFNSESISDSISYPYYDLGDLCEQIILSEDLSDNIKEKAENLLLKLAESIDNVYGDVGDEAKLLKSSYYGTNLPRGLSIFWTIGDDFTSYSYYSYNRWYTSFEHFKNVSDDYPNGYGYGAIDFCTYNNNGVVESWFELMESWYDKYNTITPHYTF